MGWDPKLSATAPACLIQIPDRFFREEMAKQGVQLPPAGQYGVGMVFLPRDPASRLACEYEIERAIKDEGQVLLGWRDVPVDNSDLAEPAKQARAGDPAGVHRPRRRRHGHRRARAQALHHPQELRPRDPGAELEHGKEFYVPSMSARTVCYKGMLLAYQVGEFYLDLRTRASSRRSRWCTSASRPTPFRPGTWRTRSA